MFLPPLDQPYSTILAAITAGTWTGASSITTVGTITSGTWQGTPVAVANGGTGSTSASAARTALGLAIGSDVQAFSAYVQSIAGLSGSAGIVCGNGSGTANARSLVAPAAGLTISNSNGAGGNPTFALSDDLLALESLSGTGILCRNATNSIVVVNIAAGTGTTVTNGDAVAGNPTISIGQDIATSSAPQFARLGIGMPAATNMGINLNPGVTGASTQYGFFSAPVSSGTAPAICAAAVTQFLTKASGGADTYADVRGVWIASNAKQSGSDTVGDNSGLVISDQTAGSTANWAIKTGLGNVYLGDDLMIGTTTAPGTNSGKSLMFGASAGNVTPGASTAGLFAKTVTQVELFAVDSAANVTQLSPHPDAVMETHAERCAALGLDPVAIPWGYQSTNDVAGVQVTVDLALLARLVERLASAHYGHPVQLIKAVQTAPTVDWDARGADTQAQWDAAATGYNRRLQRYLDKPFWLRNEHERPDRPSAKPQILPPPSWLAALISQPA